jgi:catechol 2,3-dioxygenase-like lactoylglutathione lyase family enzyme
MKVRRIAWLGVRAEDADPMVRFLRATLGLSVEHEDEGQWVFSLPDRSKVEVFSSGSAHNEHFGRAPVAGFYVDDVAAATDELREGGVEIVHGPVFSDDQMQRGCTSAPPTAICTSLRRAAISSRPLASIRNRL